MKNFNASRYQETPTSQLANLDLANIDFTNTLDTLSNSYQSIEKSLIRYPTYEETLKVGDRLINYLTLPG